MSALLGLLLAGSVPETTGCRAALAAEWPALADRMEDPVAEEMELFAPDAEPRPSGTAVPQGITQAIADAERLHQLCAQDAEASAILRSYEAHQRLRTRDYAGALRLLAAQPIDPRIATAALDAHTLLLAAAGVGQVEYRQAAAMVRAAHRKAALALGLIETGTARAGFGWIDGYRILGPEPQRIFIAWPEAGMPLTLRVPDAADDDGQGPRIRGCRVETSPMREPAADKSDAATLVYAQAVFEDARSPGAKKREWMPGPWTDAAPSCTSLDELLFAFGPPARFVGDEFALSPTPLTTRQTVRLLNGSPKQQSRAADAIIARPDLVEPAHYIQPIGLLWQRGDRLQATFLYYIWQIRFMPWAKLGSPSGEGALFGAIREMLGPEINGWIGADPALNKQLVLRALAFERRLPLHPARPEGVDSKTWLATIEEVRADAVATWPSAYPDTPEAIEKWARQRKENGLRNGPLSDTGKPLPGHWR